MHHHHCAFRLEIERCTNLYVIDTGKIRALHVRYGLSVVGRVSYVGGNSNELFGQRDTQ